MTCLVADLSSTGARVVFSGGVVPPKHFTLLLGKDGQACQARTVWRQGSMVGVSFWEARANAPEVLPG